MPSDYSLLAWPPLHLLAPSVCCLPAYPAVGLPETTAIIVVLFMVLSAFLAWLNLKLLYQHELEHFVMQEELRIHNINLQLSNEDLAAKMQELETTRKQYASKLTYQDNFRDLAETLG